MKIAVEPIDVLFFRNSKPFNAEDSPFGETLDMPYPSTFYGAIRSKILAEQCNDYQRFLNGQAELLTDVIGTPEKAGSLKISFFGLLDKQNEALLPLPKDLVVRKNSDDKNILPLKLKLKPDWLAFNLNFNYILSNPFDKKVKTPEKKFITLEQLNWYLNNILEEGDIKEGSDRIFKKEFRTGIKIDRETATVEERKLYRKEVLALDINNKYRFFLKIEGTGGLLPKKGLIKLGGESKGASYVEAEEVDSDIKLEEDTKERILKSRRFKLYLATPAIFKKGWLPNWLDKNLHGQLPETKIKVKLLTAAVDRYHTVSGWNMVENEPKTGYRLVPAGSVYYFEIIDKDFKIDDLITELHESNISDIRKEEGFGISYIGGV